METCLQMIPLKKKRLARTCAGTAMQANEIKGGIAAMSLQISPFSSF